MDFDSLIQEIRACRICDPHLPLGPNPVLQAHPEARVLIAGQAPGVRVHETSTPFNDPSGDRLRDWMGIDRATFYNERLIAIVPMGFCYPGTGKSGDLPPRPECAATWRQRLLATMPNIGLTLVIGAYAHRYHLGARRKASLTETVRDWKTFAPAKMVLPHPSPRNNGWLKKNPWFVDELLPALRESVSHLLGNSRP